MARLRADELDADRTHAGRLSALPIGGSLWADYYLRPNGEVIIIGKDLNHPDVERIVTDRLGVLTVLVWGAERYPKLRELLPLREAGSMDCPCLRHPNIFGRGKVICSECGGLGWLPRESATPETGPDRPVAEP
jgi:hypothetical protein